LDVEVEDVQRGFDGHLAGEQKHAVKATKRCLKSHELFWTAQFLLRGSCILMVLITIKK
jgi:hypothetical protein